MVRGPACLGLCPRTDVGAYFFSGQSLASFSTPLSSCPFQGADGVVVGWRRIRARGWDGPIVNTYHWNFTVWLISVQLFVLLVAGMSAHQNALSGTPSDSANFFFFGSSKRHDS